MTDQRKNPKNAGAWDEARRTFHALHNGFAKRGKTGSFLVEVSYLGGVITTHRKVLDVTRKNR